MALSSNVYLPHHDNRIDGTRVDINGQLTRNVADRIDYREAGSLHRSVSSSNVAYHLNSSDTELHRLNNGLGNDEFRSQNTNYRSNHDYRLNATASSSSTGTNDFHRNSLDYRNNTSSSSSSDYRNNANNRNSIPPNSFRDGVSPGYKIADGRSNESRDSRQPVTCGNHFNHNSNNVWNMSGGGGMANNGKRVSSFPYGGSNDSPGMYSQHSNMGSYMDGPAPSHSAPTQNQMYQGYQGQNNHPASMGVGVSPQAIGVAQQAQYLQPGQAANQRVPISHTTRASPITVQWLLENYETMDGVSLPRSTLYHHYLRHCADNKIDAVNAASFGKLIRSVFLGLKTRRLGTRGNSKYHYYGIRVQPNSPLARLTDDTPVALRAQPSGTKRSSSASFEDEKFNRNENQSNNDSETNNANSAHQQYLGDISDGLPDSPPLELTDPLPDNTTRDSIINFGNYYRCHCEALLEVISSLQFDMVESLWQSFYKSPAAANKNENGTFEPTTFNISKLELIAFCKYPPIQIYIKETDYLLYQKLVSVLVPDVLRAVPSSLTQAIRNFAKSLENSLIGSMSEMPKEIVNIKVAAVSAFSQTLRRYTSLNHLAQAARAVLQNPQQINQMWADLNKVDFNNVQEQSSWVCQCDENLIAKLEQDFKNTLAQQQTLEQWADWLKSVVSIVLEQHEGRDTYPKAARQFLLNWSFYSSMIIRDLTLRSAASFGSFHLIRLLYDEYMFYLIEHKVAAHTGKSPMSVMAECVGLSTLGQSSYNGVIGNDDDDDLDETQFEDSNDGSTPLRANVESVMQGRIPNQPEPMIPQNIYEEPLDKRMKQEYTS